MQVKIGSLVNAMHVNDKPFRECFKRAMKQAGEALRRSDAWRAKIEQRQRIRREAAKAPMIGEGI